MNQNDIKLTYSIACFDRIRTNYVAIPKCGTTSILHALAKAEDPRLLDSLRNEDFIHSLRIARYITPKEANTNGYSTIATSRCPYQRTLSMYNDLLGKRNTKRIGGSLAFVEAINKARKTKPSITNFLNILARFSDSKRDIHFRSQHYFCKDLENVTLFDITELSRFPFVVDAHMNTTTNTTILSTEEYHMIETIFADDFKLNK